MSVKDAENKKKKYHVIIIGAGIAGLASGNHLVKNGINPESILILEGTYPLLCLLINLN